MKQRQTAISSQVFLTVVSRVVMLVFGFAASVVVGRFLGPQRQGSYVVAITFAAAVTQLINFGLHSSNVYLLARDQTLLGALLGNSLGISVILGTGIACGAAAAGQALGWYHPPQSGYLWIAALMVPARLFFVLAGSLLVALRKIALFNGLQVLNSSLLLCSVVAMMLLAGGVAGFLWATMAAWSITALALLWVLLHWAGRSFHFSSKVFRTGFVYAGKAYIVCLLGFLVLRANIFVLQNLEGENEVGQYSIAAQIMDVLNLAPTSLALVLFPKLIQDTSRRWETTLISLVITGAFMLAACALCAVLLAPLVQLVYGPAYLPAVSILSWMLPATIFYGLTSVISQFLAAAGFPRHVVTIWTLGFIVNLSLSYLLIPRLAGVGASISLSIAYAIIFFLQLALAWAVQSKARIAARAIVPAGEALAIE
jgi:O-antigen/teichoic acid export membrane protein